MSDNTQIKDKILCHALGDIPFDGWVWDVIENAAIKSGYEADMAYAVFPNQMDSVMRYVPQWIDNQLIESLKFIDIDSIPVRDRIHKAIMMRYEIMAPYREAMRSYCAYWMVPTRQVAAMKLLWQSSDKIWQWAGDTSTDYNRYTKRALLSGILASATPIWLNDQTSGYQSTHDFVTRRIYNVLFIGKTIGSIDSTLKNIFPFDQHKEPSS